MPIGRSGKRAPRFSTAGRRTRVADQAAPWSTRRTQPAWARNSSVSAAACSGRLIR